ncbi:MAG: methyltransferase domain-containing protein [Pseudomonadota bacterium]
MSRPGPDPYLKRIARAPAVRALLIQCGVAPLTLAIIYVMASCRLPVDYWSVAVVQGLLAAGLTWKLGLAVWWRTIQLLFPPALLAAQALQLPSWLFLAVFLLLLGWYWSTFRTQVPYYPSTPAVWDAVRQILPPPAADGRPLRVIDIGSGLGGLVLYLARQRPDAECSGIELAPLPWMVSRLRAATSGSRARFTLGDYERLDFGRYDLVFAYLSPAAMAGLWRKAAAEMRPGAMLASYEFAIDARAPDRTIRATAAEDALYIWYF